MMVLVLPASVPWLDEISRIETASSSWSLAMIDIKSLSIVVCSNLSPEEELPHLKNEIGIFRGGPNFLANFRYVYIDLAFVFYFRSNYRWAKQKVR